MATSKLPTDAEISAIAERCIELRADLRSLDDRLRKHFDYSNDIATPALFACTFTALASAASGTAHAMLIRMANDEYRHRLEAELRAGSVA